MSSPQSNPFEQVLRASAAGRQAQAERYAESRTARREQIRAEAAAIPDQARQYRPRQG